MATAAVASCQSGPPGAGTARISTVGAAGQYIAESGAVGVEVGRVFFQKDGKTRRFRLSVEALDTTVDGPAYTSEFLSIDNIQLDLFEVAAGGRLYGDVLADSSVQPFASLQLVHVSTEDEDIGRFLSLKGTDQLGARLGAGLECSLSHSFYCDLIADYTVPISSGTYAFESGLGSDAFNRGTFDFAGYGVRLGIGILF